MSTSAVKPTSSAAPTRPTPRPAHRGGLADPAGV